MPAKYLHSNSQIDLNTERLLTTREACQFLRIARCTIYEWMKRGYVTGIRRTSGSGHYRFDIEELKRLGTKK